MAKLWKRAANLIAPEKEERKAIEEERRAAIHQWNRSVLDYYETAHRTQLALTDAVLELRVNKT